MQILPPEGMASRALKMILVSTSLSSELSPATGRTVFILRGHGVLNAVDMSAVSQRVRVMDSVSSIT